MKKPLFYKKLNMFNSKMISAVSIVLFIIVIVTIFASNRYMDICLQQEEEAQQNRLELHNLGEMLADASDYLTDEARKFSVTGEIEHLYNYWHEVYETKTRDSVISSLSSYNPPTNERELLSEAKNFSDTLIETETISMKLMLLSQNKKPEDYFYNEELYGYICKVFTCEIPEEYAALSPEEKQKKAMEILYDSYYHESKNLIMSPIQQFQSVMDTRMNSEVEKAVQGKNTASTVQIVCSVVVLVLIGFFIVALNVLYVRPLLEYSNALSDASVKEQLEHQDFSRVRVTPQGARELYNFGEVFNHLSFSLHKELKKRAAAEKEMRTARDEANRANRAKSDFFAQMSHELRTPLNAIIGYLYLLEETPMSEQQKAYCKNIDFSSENLLGLINNILDFSKIESGKMLFEIMDFDLPRLIDDIYNMMKNSAVQKHLDLKLDLSEELPQFVKGDPIKLRQVVVNLISNALKFTAEGTITLTAALKFESEGKKTVEFGVRDTGIGISEEDSVKIFEPFVQSDAGVTRKYGGTGLGLPISQMIVRNASGGKYEIEVESVPNKGSYFHFCMDFLPGIPTVSDTAVCEQCESFENNTSILLVDDNKINLEMEKHIFERYGLAVTTVESGAEAIEYAERYDYDMIFLDLHMPEMDGYETAKRLRFLKKCKYTPIIALTADVVSGVEEKVKKSDINGYISKPFKPEQLRNLIKQYLNIANHYPEKLLAESNIIFSYDECLEKLNGNCEVLQSLVQRFLDNHSSDCDYIKTHIEDGYLGNARNILHDVIGISGNLCCRRLYNYACRLRLELHEERTDSFSEFCKVWNETIEAMKTYMSFHTNNSTSKLNTPPFAEIWEQFYKRCEEYDISVVEYFEKYDFAFKHNFENSIFMNIKEAVNRYDFMWITENFSDKEE